MNDMLRFYNTLSKEKQELKPLAAARGEKLLLFVCGITPYDFAHLGHARTYVAFDLIVKYLRLKGFKVFYLQNITDIDDKIIQRAKEANETPRVLARRFERAYLKSMKALGVNSVNKYARATLHIKEIVGQISRLLLKGYAYQTSDGVYYDITRFKSYGKLSGRTISQAEDAVSRIDESVQKRNKGDFALWKLSKEGEPSWQSPWGKGRPGWHIEDTAITEKYFGAQYDIHGGSRDLLFPHHEAEIAQMEAISGLQPLVRFWMHSGFLTIGGEKMSKSLGNFITIEDFISKYSARLLRFLIIKTHYRSPIDYSEALVEQAKQELFRIDEFVARLGAVASASANKKQSSLTNLLNETYERFSIALEDDINVPEAFAVLFDLIKQGNILIDGNSLSRAEAKEMIVFLKKADTIFDCIFKKEKSIKIPADVAELMKKREEARKGQHWHMADSLRKDIEAKGWQVDDTPAGPRLMKTEEKK